MQEGLVLVEHRRIMGPKCVGQSVSEMGRCLADAYSKAHEANLFGL